MGAGICADGRVKQIVLPSEGLSRRKRFRQGGWALLTVSQVWLSPLSGPQAFRSRLVSTPWALSLPGLRTTPPALLVSACGQQLLSFSAFRVLSAGTLLVQDQLSNMIQILLLLLPLVKGALRSKPVYRPRASGMQGWGWAPLRKLTWSLFLHPSPKGPVTFHQGNCP